MNENAYLGPTVARMSTGNDPEDLRDRKCTHLGHQQTQLVPSWQQLIEIDNTDNNDPSRSHNGNGSDDDRVYVTHSVVLKEVTSRAAGTSCLKESKMESTSVRTRFYFIIVSICLIVETTTQENPKRIVDGILISGGTSQNAIQVLDSVWTTHVAVGSISNDIQLAPLISRLQELITGFPSTSRADDVTRSYWQQRLQIIRSTAPPVVTPHERRRRGLNDVGGQILHSLFGLATSNQVQISRQMINIIRKSNKHIIHQSNNMISVINQTYTEMKLNRRHIIDVDESLSALYEHVNTWITGRQTAWSRISASLQIDRVLIYWIVHKSFMINANVIITLSVTHCRPAGLRKLFYPTRNWERY